MILRGPPLQKVTSPSPRTRGDDPLSGVNNAHIADFSPHPRG